MSPMVSVIVPFYNVEEYLRPCLDSIRAQTLGDMEVILVDDGSPDSSVEHARDVIGLDSRFRLVSQENQGLGPARNVGAEHSQGRYLMFVDSDDLLAPRALEQLVTSLETSGSDFAAGHVWRLSLARGLETSWAHREPFAEHLHRTSIREIPLLMRDRMAWNKVWRRSFWEDGGYRFPAIRFEDFPVTLKAHLQATAVDTLPAPMYVWRERPSGTSISQQGKELGNVRDRVTAALSVLQTVDSLASEEVRELVHSHLVDVDVREVIESLVSAESSDAPEIEALARRLVSRIDPDCVALAAPQLTMAYRALGVGDLERVRGIVRYRQGDRDDQALAAVGLRPGSGITGGIRRGRAVARRAASRAGLAPPARPRRARLEDVTVLSREIHYRLTMPLRIPGQVPLRVTTEIGSALPRTRVSRLPDGIQVEVEVDTAHLIALPVSPTRMRVTVAAGPLHWSGGVSVSVDQLHGAHRGGSWIQAVSLGGELAFSRSRRAPLITRVDTLTGVVRMHTDVPEGAVVIERPWPSAPVTAVITDGVVELSAADLVRDDPADNPLSGRAERRVMVRRAVTPRGVPDHPLRLAGPGIATVITDDADARRRIRIGRAWDGTAVLIHEPAE